MSSWWALNRYLGSTHHSISRWPKICISLSLSHFLSLSLSASLSVPRPPPRKCFPLLAIVLKKIIQEFINFYQQQINKITKFRIKFMDRNSCLVNLMFYFQHCIKVYFKTFSFRACILYSIQQQFNQSRDNNNKKIIFCLFSSCCQVLKICTRKKSNKLLKVSFIYFTVLSPYLFL